MLLSIVVNVGNMVIISISCRQSRLLFDEPIACNSKIQAAVLSERAGKDVADRQRLRIGCLGRQEVVQSALSYIVDSPYFIYFLSGFFFGNPRD